MVAKKIDSDSTSSPQSQKAQEFRLVGEETQLSEQDPKYPSNKPNESYRNKKWGAAQLKKVPIFGGLHNNELEDVYSIGKIRQVKPHSHVVIEGENTRGIYFIIEGTVSIYKTDPATGTMQRLTYLEKGNNFGELSLIDHAPRSATVAAESACLLFYLDADDFANFLNEQGYETKARFFEKCAEELVHRLRQQNADYVASQQLLWRYALRNNSK